MNKFTKDAEGYYHLALEQFIEDLDKEQLEANRLLATVKLIKKIDDILLEAQRSGVIKFFDFKIYPKGFDPSH